MSRGWKAWWKCCFRELTWRWQEERIQGQMCETLAGEVEAAVPVAVSALGWGQESQGGAGLGEWLTQNSKPSSMKDGVRGQEKTIELVPAMGHCRKKEIAHFTGVLQCSSEKHCVICYQELSNRYWVQLGICQMLLFSPVHTRSVEKTEHYSLA